MASVESVAGRAVVIALALGAGPMFGACGAVAGDDGAATCVGESFDVAGTPVTLVGVGRAVSDAYVTANLLFDTDDGERITISSYSGATVALPGTATDGWTAWHGQRIDVVNAAATPGPGQIAPCVTVEVSELPPDWEPPGDEEPAGH